MADSVVSLGLDLSAFDATLRQGFDGLGKGAQRALAQAKAAAAQAARESASALRLQLSLQAQAARDQQRAQADQLRAEQALTRETERRAVEQARAARQLAGLAAGRSETERLTHAYREQIAEIQRLVEVTGDQRAGARAVAAATAQYQAQLKTQTAEVKTATGSSYAFGQQVQSLRKNILDLGQGIAAGQSPVQALTQQLPAITEAALQSGDAIGSLRAAVAPLTTALSALAAPLAAAALAAAALATAYVVLKNQSEAASTSTAGLVLQVEASRAALERARAAVAAQSQALRTLADGAATAEEDLAVLVGTADRHEVAMRREIAALEDRSRQTALAATTQLAAARTALVNEKALYANVNASVSARAEASARIKILEAEIRTQQVVVDTARTDLERQREAIRLGAEYRRELEQSNAALEARDRAQRAASASSARDAVVVKTQTDRLAELADQLVDVARLFDEASFLTVPADLVSPATLDSLRSLERQIDRLVPPQVLDRVQELELLLSDVGRLVPTEQTREWEQRLIAARDAAAAIDFEGIEDEISAAAAELERVVGTTSLWRQALGSTLSAGVRGAQALATSLSAAAGIDFSAFTSIQGFAQFAIQTAGQAVTAQREAAAGLAAAREDLSEALQTGDVEAIAAARAAVQEARAQLDAARPTAFVSGLIEGAASFVQALARQLPAILDGVIASLPRLIDALVDAIPQVIVALVEAIPSVAAELAIALAIELPIALVQALPDIVKALGRGIVEAWQRAGRAIRDLLRDIVREAVTGGRADTRTFGDTPGPVRVGPLGARVSPGDYVVAARSREGLAAQVGGSAGGGSVTVLLDVRDGPVALGLSRAVTREIGRSGLGRDSSGRRSPYARR